MVTALLPAWTVQKKVTIRPEQHECICAELGAVVLEEHQTIWGRVVGSARIVRGFTPQERNWHLPFLAIHGLLVRFYSSLAFLHSSNSECWRGTEDHVDWHPA
eukprot:2644187-Amphidinium_carterae.1